MRRRLAPRPSLLAVVTAATLAACGSAGSNAGAGSGPSPIESPPRTRDPGVVIDEKPLGTNPPPERGGGPSSASGARPDGASCFVAEDCASGVCEGPGCGETRPGTCAPRTRACTKDLRPYCSCDGVTFRASGTCPGQRYASKTECSTGK